MTTASRPCTASLTINDGEFMVLVGPSGCGKTTTLRMVAGLEDITSGDISIGERRINDVEPKDRDIAMVFQNYALYPHMTIFENMAYGLKLRRTPKAQIKERVMHAAGMLGLEQQLTKWPKQLSGGQRQRVALGVPLYVNQRPFYSMNRCQTSTPNCAATCYELKTLQQQLATTAVYVTHDQIEAMTLGDRITVMNAGKIQQVADPTTLYDWPANRFVAGFIGTPPMNFLAGTLDNGQFIAAGGSAGGSADGTANSTAVPLTMANQQRLAGHDQKAVTLGIRPEHLRDTRHEPAEAGMAQMTVQVKVVEVLGDHQYVSEFAAAADNGSLSSNPGVSNSRRQHRRRQRQRADHEK